MKATMSFILSLLLSFFAPITFLLMPILYLVLIDIGTGMYVVRFKKKQPLTSRGFFKKLPQLVTFFVALTAALHSDPFFSTLGIEEYQAAKLVISFYGIYELFSILENLGELGLPIAKQIKNALQAKLPEGAETLGENTDKK